MRFSYRIRKRTSLSVVFVKYIATTMYIWFTYVIDQVFYWMVSLRPLEIETKRNHKGKGHVLMLMRNYWIGHRKNADDAFLHLYRKKRNLINFQTDLQSCRNRRRVRSDFSGDDAIFFRWKWMTGLRHRKFRDGFFSSSSGAVVHWTILTVLSMFFNINFSKLIYNTWLWEELSLTWA